MISNPSAWRNVSKLSPYIERLRTGSGRVLDLLIGDSTILFGGHGNDAGAAEAHIRYGNPPWATPFYGPAENYGAGGGIGHYAGGFFAVASFATAQQQVAFTDVTAPRNGETFRFVLDGNNSADCVFSNVVATMRTNIRNALATLPGFTVNNIFVHGTYSGATELNTSYKVFFSGNNVGKVFNLMTRTTPVAGTNYAGSVNITSITVGSGDWSLVPPTWWSYLEPTRQITKWRISIFGSPSSGSFGIQYLGLQNQNFNETATIAYNADGPAFQAALEGLASLDPGDVSVTGPVGGPWVVTFLETGKCNFVFQSDPLFIANTMNNGATPQFENMSANIGTLVPRYRVNSSAGATQAMLIDGNAATSHGVATGFAASAIDNSIWTIKGPGTIGGSCLFNTRGQQNGNSETVRIQIHNASAGTFTLSFGGNTTTALQWNDSAANVQAALVALASIGGGNATVTKNAVIPSLWVVTFAGGLASTDLAGVFTADLTSITRRDADVVPTFATSTYEGRVGAVFFPLLGADVPISSSDAAAVVPYVLRTTQSLAADATRTYPLNVMAEKNGATATPPLAWLFMMSDRPATLNGALVQPLVAIGGRALRTFVYALRNYPPALMLEYFSAMRWAFIKVGQAPCFRIRVHTGVNDRNDAALSVGGSALSNTAQGFYDNLVALRAFFESFWIAQGWAVTELHYSIHVSPMTQSDDADLIPFRTAANDFSDNFDRTASSDWSKLVTNFAEAQTFWTGGSDSSHLIPQGYYDMHRRDLQSMYDAYTPTVPMGSFGVSIGLSTALGERTALADVRLVSSIEVIPGDAINIIEINIPVLHGATWAQMPLSTTPIPFSHINGIPRINLRSQSGASTSAIINVKG